MPFARIDTGFHRHPKASAVGIHGRALYISGLCFCAEQLTDGRIPKGSVPIVAAEAGVKLSVADALVQVGLWHDRGDHYAVNDYFDRGNPTRASVLADREKARSRQQLARASRPKSQRDSPRDAERSSAASHGYGLLSQGFTSSSSCDARPTDDDDEVTATEPRVEDALAILGEHDLEKALADGIDVKATGPYLAGCIRKRRLSDARPLAAKAADHPEWTSAELAAARLGRTRPEPRAPLERCPECSLPTPHHLAECPSATPAAGGQP